MSELRDLAAGLEGGSALPVEAVAEIGRKLEIDWPADYVEFLTQIGGGAGWIGEIYLQAWPPEELVPSNVDLNLAEFAPNLVGFGSDGGGELFAFDRSFDPPHIVMTPMIGWGLVNDFGISFLDFLRGLTSGEIPPARDAAQTPPQAPNPNWRDEVLRVLRPANDASGDISER
jgi:hypothetical protein